MTADKTVLAIDSGTQSVRAILFDERGNELAVGRHPHQPLLRPRKGAVEQDTDDMWNALAAACRDCMDEARRQDLPMPLAAGLTSQRKLLIPTDRNGEPLMPALHWLDKRSARPRKAGLLGRTVLALSGDEGLLTTLISISQANVLQAAYPEVYERAERLLSLTGWITHRLTGQFRDAEGSITGVYPYDVKSGRWRTTPALVDLLGFRLEKLPEVVPAGTELGRVTSAAAEETGLPAGLPIVAVGGDKQAEVLGSGLTPRDGAAAEISMGTGTSLTLVRRKLQESRALKWISNNAAQPGCYCHEYMVFRGFWTWTWFLDQFGHRQHELARQRGCTPEEVLSEEVQAVPPGCEGLLVIPRWYPTFEDLHERGAVIGFAEHHTNAHLARAVVEGIVLDLRRGAEVMGDRFGARLDKLRIGGGGSRSEWSVQTVADVFDRPVEIPHTRELSALGAAINAAVAAGLYPDHATAAENMTRIERTVRPIAANVATYARIYRDGFLPAMEALKPIYPSVPVEG